VRRTRALVSWESYGTKENIIIKKIIAAVLVVLGLGGLLLGRLGETVWAPPTSHTATATLDDPGPAVVIDPGVLYVGGTEGTATITSDSDTDVSVITASNDDIDSYLKGVRSTRITGVPTWQTLKTEAVDPDGKKSLKDPTHSDLWRSVDTSKSPVELDVAEFAEHEMTKDPQPYRAILLVTDGKDAGATKVSITWPADEKNTWVPYAYAGGAAIAVIGLALLVVSLSFSRRPEREVREEKPLRSEGADQTDHSAQDDTESETAVADAAHDGRFVEDGAHDEQSDDDAAHDLAAGDERPDDDAAHEEQSDDEDLEHSHAAPAGAQEARDEVPTGDEENAWAGAELPSRRGRHASWTPDDAPTASTAPVPDEESADEEPATEQAADDGPASQDPAAEEPATEEPAAEGPTGDEPKEPVDDAPAEPSAEEPSTDVLDPVQDEPEDEDSQDRGSNDRREHE
jgi:hypothetical protein